MKTRIITAIVAVCILVPVLVFSNTWVLPIAAAICCALSVFEMLRCCGLLKKYAISVPLMLIGVLAPLSVRFFSSFGVLLTYAVPVILALVFYFLAVMVFSKGKTSIEDVSVAGFTSFYIVFAFVALLSLRYYEAMGAYVYLMVFIGAWITDIFAYFCGMLLGKHKLIPEVSPKKTVEGSVGGILFCGLSFILYGLILQNGLNVIADVNFIQLFLYGVVVSVVSQIGDLSMSAIKRRYDVKDFGKIFPGHGGMLDRFDSILAVSSVLFILNEISGVFTAIS